MTKGAISYTDNRLDKEIMLVVQKQILKSFIGDIVSVSLEPIEFGRNFVLNAERCHLTMFRQILLALEKSTTDVIYALEHDVLYHSSHFVRNPDGLEYNQNVWKVSSISGRALHYPCSQVSGLSGPRQILLDHYKARVALVESVGFSTKMGFEPGTHNRPERVDDLTSTTWMSDFPNIDIRHTTNLTKTRWTKEEFKNPKYTHGWTESDSVPGWGLTQGRFSEFLQDLL